MRTKAVFILCVALLFCGCSNSGAPLNSALSLRKEILNSTECSFHTTVTADYGEQLCDFSMDCLVDREGNLSFTVTAPETIAGITGTVSSAGGSITFDDRVLAFQTIADGQVSPVSAPWLLIKTLRSGYLRSCTYVDSGLEISIDDSYAEEALRLIILTRNDVPSSAEIFWQGRRVLTLTVENFNIL